MKAINTEQERQQLIDAFSADQGPGWAQQSKPGSFGCHELLDRTALVADMLEHPIRQRQVVFSMVH